MTLVLFQLANDVGAPLLEDNNIIENDWYKKVQVSVLKHTGAFPFWL